MFVLLSALVVTAAQDPAVLDTITREIAQAVSADARLDVKSELDLKAIIDLEVGRQTCGADSQDCSAELANAYSAQVVVMSHLNEIDGELRVDISIYDAKNQRFHPTSVRGLKVRELLDQIPGAVRAALAPLPDMPAGTVVFVGRTAGAPPQAAPAPPPAAPSPLVVVGGVAAGLGAVVVVVGAGLYGYAYSQNTIAQDATKTDEERIAASNTARGLEVPSIATAVAGAVIAGIGAAIFFVAE